MKGRRTTAIYFLVLVLLAGYFYYFEVIQKEHKEADEKAAKKIFHAVGDQMLALEIQQAGKPVMKLEKKTVWRISEPIEADVDEPAVKGLVTALGSLEMERKVVGNPQNLDAYGLKTPALKIRFLPSDGQWREILIGDRNPSGSGRYAMAAGQNEVLLIDEGDWGELNKSPNDLRRRTLLAFEPEDVKGVQVAWRDGASFSVAREEGDSKDWKAQGGSEMKVKSSKIDNLLDQLGVIRADEFLEAKSKEGEDYGLDPADVVVSLDLKDGRKEEVRLGKKLDAKKNAMAASSSEITAPVQVDGRILDVLPKALHDLEDRSLLASFESDSVGRVAWILGDAHGEAVRAGEGKWSMKKTADAKPVDLERPWRVNSLFWELREAEYEKKSEPSPPVPAQPYAKLELGESADAVSLTWDKLPDDPAKAAESGTVWKTEKGAVQAFEIKSDALRKIEGKLRDLSAEETKNQEAPAN